MAKMFTGKEDGSISQSSQTVIGEAIKVEGTFTGSGNITVKGEVIGTLKTSDDLIIEASAKIEADIEARNITVAGSIKGNVVCHGQFTVQSTAQIFGDVTTNIISVDTGAVMQGHCTTGAKPAATTEPTA